MRTSAWTSCAVSVVVLLTAATACAHQESPASGSNSPSQRLDSPSRAEVTAAVVELVPGTQARTVQVLEVKPHGEDGWQATAEIWPPMEASYNPSRVVLAKDADGWRIVSARPDSDPPYVTPSSEPAAQP